MPAGSSVTVLVPVLNEEDYIRDAIASLVPEDNTFDYELIVLDGGSTDRSREIVQEITVGKSFIQRAIAAAQFSILASAQAVYATWIDLHPKSSNRAGHILCRADCRIDSSLA